MRTSACSFGSRPELSTFWTCADDALDERWIALGHLAEGLVGAATRVPKRVPDSADLTRLSHA
jgi:hypothetical protein